VEVFDGRRWSAAAVNGGDSDGQRCKVVVNGEKGRKKKQLQQIRLPKKSNCSNEG